MPDDKPDIDELLALQGENRPEDFPGHRPGPGNSVTREESAERRVFMAKLLMGQYESDEIYSFMETKFKMDQKAVNRLELQIYKIWEGEDTKRAKYWKSAARRRILKHIRDAASDGNWPSVMAGEKILTGIEGTNAPIEIRTHAKVEHSHAVLNLIGQLSEDEVRALAQSERALLGDGQIIDAEVEPVQEENKAPIPAAETD
jgi:hypothetical protein